MTTPLITVGIPFYNCEHYLLDSIRSIFAQTYSNWELILVDDGSTDKSLEIALSIDDPRVRVLPSDGENKHLPTRLNQITQAARGEFIARMDTDDMSHPERFARQLTFLKTHPEVDIVGSSMYILGLQKKPVSKLIVPERHDMISRNKFKRVPMVHPSVMARASWFRQWPYDEKLPRAQDYNLWLRSLPNSIFSNIAEPLYLCDAFTFFSLSKYTQSKHIGAKFIWKYAPVEIGRLRATYYAGRRYIQIAVYAAFGVLGLRHLLVQHRYPQLTPEERQKANVIIDIIRKTEVPLKKKSS